jgi:hypothetical protein
MTDRLAYYTKKAEENLGNAEDVKGVQQSTSMIGIKRALTGIGYAFLAWMEAGKSPQQGPYELWVDGEKLDVTGNEDGELAKAVERLADSIDRSAAHR